MHTRFDLVGRLTLVRLVIPFGLEFGGGEKDFELKAKLYELSGTIENLGSARNLGLSPGWVWASSLRSITVQ